jgi:hypothetical protein
MASFVSSSMLWRVGAALATKSSCLDCLETWKRRFPSGGNFVKTAVPSCSGQAEKGRGVPELVQASVDLTDARLSRPSRLTIDLMLEFGLDDAAIIEQGERATDRGS